MTKKSKSQGEDGKLAFWFIRKRSGDIVPFDEDKITGALDAAGTATREFSKKEARELAFAVIQRARSTLDVDIPSVEDIQDIAEDVLLASPFKKTAKAFILYRDQHARNRGTREGLDLDMVDRYVQRMDWRIQESSNESYSLQGLHNYISNEASRKYWLNRIYTPDVREAHLSGDCHVHDLGYLSVYCVGWDLLDLLRSGLRGGPAKVESGPARHFRTALGQIVNFFYTLQGEAAGAQAFANFDTLLAPFIRYDGLSYGEVKQALQEFVFNLNVPTRVGFQTPFTNLTFDLVPHPVLAKQNVVVGGTMRDESYDDFEAEMCTLNLAFLEVLLDGDARGRVFTFPIPTYNVTPSFNWESPAVGRLCEVAAKFGSPFFANFVSSGMSPEDFRAMCCNLRLDLHSLRNRGGGLFGAYPQTGSIGVVTINLPRLGYLAEDETDFLSRLDAQMEIARTALETKRKVLERFTEGGLYPYTRFYLREIKKGLGSYWHNHFSTIGLLGMNEASLNLLGTGIGTQEGAEFAGRVLDHMRGRVTAFQEETGNIYNLEATPAESATYRLALADKARYPDIICANERHLAAGAKPFYTNSSRLPVDFSDDIVEVLRLQDPLQTKYTGGTVLHVFLGEAVPDPNAVKAFVRVVCSQYRLPYFTVSPSFSICPSHGYLNGEQPTCPQCGAVTEVYARVVGYLRPVKHWNEGKQAEFAIRRKFRIEVRK